MNNQCIRIKYFKNPSKDWALFVINNRNRGFKDTDSLLCNHDNKFDIVIGPIANDDLVLLFRQFSGGMIGVDTLVTEMEYKELTDQYSFHSELSIKYLRKLGAYYV